ncbi:MAG: Ig-like domain-containing protein [Bacteroidales bacterium]|nr:Ig-like domain-containing protein [Bacteroidales bacterium]MBN2698825.1 Ig-like domain-containing protein [Bacteroidales bacterium]
MKKKHFILSLMLFAAVSLVMVQSCEEDPVDPVLETMVAGDIDLNAAAAPTNVPVDPEIVATFNVEIDAATATSANITLTQEYDDADIPLTIAASGKTITITPVDDLGNGAMYQLKLGAGIMSVDGLALTELTRSFTTTGAFVPAGAIAHWNFEGNAQDVVGNYDPTASQVVAITYTASRNAAAGTAATFDGDASIIEISNGDQLINASEFTLSFWMKTNSTNHVGGHFVMGLGAFYGLQYEVFGGYDGSKFAISYEIPGKPGESEDMWFPALATDNTNGGWQGWTYAKSLTAEEMIALLKDHWLHVVYTFNGPEKEGILYFNGEKMKSFDFDLWPDDAPKKDANAIKYRGVAPEVVNELAFGFVQSRAGTLWDSEGWGGYDFPDANHFKGQLDDIRFFHKVLTSTEIQLMYDSEK